jgi:phenylacetate-CoA ligase
MPMIRYRIGDVGRLSQRVCACGRGLPLLEEVSGRVTDFLVTRDGTLVSGVFLATYVVANKPSLGQVQIYQQRSGSVCYRIRPSGSFDPDADVSYLVQRTRKFLGNDCEVTWETVEDFPVTPSGKFRFSLSEVTPSFLAGSAGRTSFQEHPGMEP